MTSAELDRAIDKSGMGRGEFAGRVGITRRYLEMLVSGQRPIPAKLQVEIDAVLAGGKRGSVIKAALRRILGKLERSELAFGAGRLDRGRALLKEAIALARSVLL